MKSDRPILQERIFTNVLLSCIGKMQIIEGECKVDAVKTTCSWRKIGGMCLQIIL